MSISIVGLLVALVLILVVIWATGKLLAAFETPQPLATVIHVVVVVICVLIALGALGLLPFGSVRLN